MASTSRSSCSDRFRLVHFQSSTIGFGRSLSSQEVLGFERGYIFLRCLAGLVLQGCSIGCCSNRCNTTGGGGGGGGGGSSRDVRILDIRLQGK